MLLLVSSPQSTILNLGLSRISKLLIASGMAGQPTMSMMYPISQP